MNGVGHTIAAGGSTVIGAAVIVYLAQWMRMPPMSQEVAGAFALLASGAIHAAALFIQKKWGVNIEAPVVPPAQGN